jgi:hypothetical protein
MRRFLKGRRFLLLTSKELMMAKRMWIIAAVGITAALMTGCASAPANAAASMPTEREVRREQSENSVDTGPRRSTIIDWSNRNLGEDAVPLWLKPLVKGNSAPVKSEFDIPSDSRVKFSLAQRANRDEARVQAGLLFAARIANELKTCVMTAAAQTLNEGQIDIIEEITTAAKVNITGTERVADFWQLVETEDPVTRIIAREYIYYVVWAMPQATWTALTRKYVNDVIGQIPDRAVQTNVASAYGEIQAAADRENAMTDAEFQQRLRMQEQAARDAQEREMAKINQQTQAEASARYAAYRSGDTNAAAAASATAADVDWISALGAVANIVF